MQTKTFFFFFLTLARMLLSFSVINLKQFSAVERESENVGIFRKHL